jgi:hypothetical protein
MFACKEILPELIARFEALDEVSPRCSCRFPLTSTAQDGSGEVDVSELEELLEAAGEKVNPLELESVFQVRGAKPQHVAQFQLTVPGIRCGW